MKKQFLSVLAFTAILLSSCGGTAKIEKASACGQEGEITASSATAIAETESGKVAGYVENGIYIYKGIPYAKAERFMPPVAADKWEGVRSSRAYGPTCPQGKRMGWYSDEQAFAFNWDDGYPEYLDTGTERREETPRHGVAAWWRLFRRQWSGASLV